MIFLFNTSEKRSYLENIFATLHFPYGMINEYQYPCNSLFVDDSIRRNYRIGDDVIISFVDKDIGNESIYLPIRRGELVSVQEADGRIYIKVKLLDYCHAKVPMLYSNFIEHNLNGKVYHREDDGKWKGLLAVKKEVQINSLLEMTDDSWIITAKKLSVRKKFSDNYSIFTKIHIVDENDKELKAVKRGRKYGYRFKSENKYTVKLSYYIDEYNNNPMTKIHAMIEDSQNICGIVSKEIEINNRNSIHKCPIEVKSISKSQSTFISIKCQEEKIENKDIVHVTKPLNIFVDSKINVIVKRALIGLCVLAIGVSTWVSTMPVESIIKDAEEVINSKKDLGNVQSIMYSICLILNECKYFYNAICSAISTVFTFILICLYGKPKL